MALNQDVPLSEHVPAVPLDPNAKYYWRVRSFNTIGHYSSCCCGIFPYSHIGTDSCYTGKRLFSNQPAACVQLAKCNRQDDV